MMRFCLLILLLAISASAVAGLRDGDVIFQTSRSTQSAAVQRATGSRYSHMGLVMLRGDKTYVLEAAATVQYTPLPQWVARGLGHHYVVKRLRDADTRLTPAALRQLRIAADRLLGRPYDLAFGWSDERIYCSELVWKIYDRALGVQIGRPQRLQDFDLTDPVVQAKLRERYGSRVPLDEVVVSPKAMYDSALLVTVEAQ